MHIFPCKCGHTITIDPPCHNAGYVVWDSDVHLSINARRKEIRGFLSAVSTGQRDAWMRYFYGANAESRLIAKTDTDVIEDIMSKHDDYTHICYGCDVCGRLYVQARPGTDEFREYRSAEQ